MGSREVFSDWWESRPVVFVSTFAGLATGIALFVLFLVWSNRVPEQADLVAVSGDAVVVEGGYAHLTTASGPLKITYDCACGRGWQASMREGKQVEALVRRVNGRRAEAFHVVVDGNVLVDGAQARARYERNLALAGGFALLGVPMLGLRWARRRRHRLLGPAARQRPIDVLSDAGTPWPSRREALESLLGSKDPEVVWTLHDLCTRNTEPVAVLEALGTALAQQVERTGEDEVGEEELAYLQIPAKRSYDAEMTRLGGDRGLGGTAIKPQVEPS